MLRNTNSVARVVCSAALAKTLTLYSFPNVPQLCPPAPNSLPQGQSCSLMKVIFSAGIKNVVVAPRRQMGAARVVVDTRAISF
jgi:hypothetical protein